VRIQIVREQLEQRFACVREEVLEEDRVDEFWEEYREAAFEE
jgi:hypothetical protein